MAGAQHSNGPSGAFNWTSLIALGSLIAAAIYGQWALLQSQLTSVRETIELHAKADAERIALVDGALKERTADINKIIKDLHDADIDIHQELRHDVVGQHEFAQFQARIESLAKRLDITEATRPTTGEVQINVTGVQKQIDALREALRDLTPKFARNPAEEVEVEALRGQIRELQSRLDLLTPQPRFENNK